MEITTHSLSHAKFKSLVHPSLISAKSNVFSQKSTAFLGNNLQPIKLKCRSRHLIKFGVVISASVSESSLKDARWVLQPTGDGDTKHIGYKIAMPGAFEIASNVVTVGRVREKADIVISVPTVSATHARIEKTDKNLLITDLDSTNGTYIGEKRLVPGVVSAASPGNLVIFGINILNMIFGRDVWTNLKGGDTNLAIFRVYKLEKEVTDDETDKSGTESEDEASIILESTI